MVRTVQGDLEAALSRLIGPTETFVAGRTDAGVHATGQVVSFSTTEQLDTERIARALNKMLGPEIAALRVTKAGDGFHARFSAAARQYRYLVLNRAAPDPFLAGRVWHVTSPLDAEAMNAAAAVMEGEHDFASFCRREGEAPTVRTVVWSRWHRDGDLVELSIAASSFCHQMVRSITALCVEVGRGRRAASDAMPILDARVRAAASGAAPAHGLTLVAVAYDDEPLSPPPWLDRTS